jgi:hypothetical protein
MCAVAAAACRTSIVHLFQGHSMPDSTLQEPSLKEPTEAVLILQRQLSRALQISEEAATLLAERLARIDELAQRLHVTMDSLASTAPDKGHTLGEDLGAISLEAMEALNALQFHDITRQAVEHVDRALGELAEPLANGCETCRKQALTHMNQLMQDWEGRYVMASQRADHRPGQDGAEGASAGVEMW